MKHIMEDLDYQIGYDEIGYFVYLTPGIPIYRGNYTRCLIVIGGIALGQSLNDSILRANEVTFRED